MPRSLISTLEKSVGDPDFWPDTKRIPRATMAQISRSESGLQFELPALLRDLYLNIANGGFLDLLGVIGGATDHLGRNAVDIYTQSVDPNSGYRQWPDKLLPVRYLGCTHYECADCRYKRATIIEVNTCSFFIDELPWEECHDRSGKSLRQWLCP